MSFLRKSILPIVLTIAFIFVASVGYFYWQGGSKSAEVQTQNKQTEIPIVDQRTVTQQSLVNWKKYVDTNTGFSLRYPPSIVAVYTDPTIHLPSPIDSLILSIYSQKVESLGIESPDANNRKYALAEMQALQRGQFGYDNDFIVPASRRVVKIGNVYGKSYVVFGRFIICDRDITFQRTLRFYLNGYQIEVSIYGPTSAIVNSTLQYFYSSQGEPAISYPSEDDVCWRPDGEGKFYEKLTEGKAPDVAQNWYDTFDDVISTIELPTDKSQIAN